MRLIHWMLAMAAGLTLAAGGLPALADQSDPPDEAPNVRAESNRDTRDGYHREGADWISDHVQNYSGNGTSSYAPASSKANDNSQTNPSRD